jgi:hypothetical protein
MFGDSITLYRDGSGGSAYVLKKINQDSYSSEYLARDGVSEQRLKVRHSVENPINGLGPLERHNVEFQSTYFEDGSTYLEDERHVVSVTVRAPKTASSDLTTSWVHALTFWLSAAAAAPVDTVPVALVNWES